MDIPLRCACGAIEGRLAEPQMAVRAICYCKDCQTFADLLGGSRQVLDAAGGTDIIATVPQHIRFTRGVEQLRCMSLSDKGLLRWYCERCRTPIGNTPRDPKTSYVGLVRTCLATSAEEIDRAFGKARLTLNTESARVPVASHKLALLPAMLKIMRNVLGARLTGAWRRNPFFRPGGAEPLVAATKPR
jgi:hypothetical protein